HSFPTRRSSDLLTSLLVGVAFLIPVTDSCSPRFVEAFSKLGATPCRPQLIEWKTGRRRAIIIVASGPSVLSMGVRYFVPAGSQEILTSGRNLPFRGVGRW